jgi:glyoxylase-like metal-dependent hydrolase (beta-lactamase superfamily II)
VSDGAPPGDREPAHTVAAAAGIHRLAIPTPFLVGRVNCYLIEDEPLTLVDTGPNSGKSLDALERALAERGRSIEDIELLIITHQHMDHLGLLEIIARRSGAEVAAFGPLRAYLENFARSAVADDEFSQALMRRHGIPEDLIAVLGSVGAAFRAFGSSGTVTRPLADGDTITLRDRTLEVRHRPGHSPSDTVFWDAERRILLAGDHLLAHISSNPLVSRPLRADADSEEPTRALLAADADSDMRPRALLTYMASLSATRTMPAELVLGGHGDPVVDHTRLIDERFRMHDRRAGKIRRLIEARPLSAYEIALEMWGNIAVTQAYLTLSEVLGHADLLVERGEAVELVEAGIARFHAV